MHSFARFHSRPALAALALAACSSSPSTSTTLDAAVSDVAAHDVSGDVVTSTDATSVTMIDGRILFRGLGEGVAWAVELYATPVAAPPFVVRGDGHCDVHPLGGGDTFIQLPPAGTLDLGASVTATSGAQTLTQPVDTTGGAFSYVFTQAGLNAFGMNWTLANAGSLSGLAATTLATVHVPTSVAPIVPAPMGGMVNTTSGHVTLQWTGGAGAQSFHINIPTPSVEIDCYPAPTATQFTLPSNIVAMLPASVTPLLWAETVTVLSVGARRVWVRVTSDNLD